LHEKEVTDNAEKIENIIDFQMFEDPKVFIVDDDENTVELLSSMIES
jgi:hypothetical protein